MGQTILDFTPENKGAGHTTSYREVLIGKTLFRVTSVYKGEKELGAALEKLAVRHVLDEMDGKAKELLRA